MAVEIRRDDASSTLACASAGTASSAPTAYTDPAEGMIGILFTQRMMDSPDPPPVFTDFWTLAWQGDGVERFGARRQCV